MENLGIGSSWKLALPELIEGLEQAKKYLTGIQCFDDIERLFLERTDISDKTKRSYSEAEKQFYEYTKSKHPLHVTTEDVLRFHDYVEETRSLATAYQRINALKNVYKNIKKKIPIYKTPFEKMSDENKRKLTQTRFPKIQHVLTRDETNHILSYYKNKIRQKIRDC